MEVLQHDKDIQGPAEDLDSIVVMTQPALKYHLVELRFVKSISCLEANSSSNSYCQTNLNHMSSTKLSHIPTAWIRQARPPQKKQTKAWKDCNP